MLLIEPLSTSCGTRDTCQTLTIRGATVSRDVPEYWTTSPGDKRPRPRGQGQWTENWINISITVPGVGVSSLSRVLVSVRPGGCGGSQNSPFVDPMFSGSEKSAAAARVVQAGMGGPGFLRLGSVFVSYHQEGRYFCKAEGEG